MTVEQLQLMQQARPFKPYRMHLADGRALEVHHRDFVARSPTGRFAIVYEPDGGHQEIDLMLVTSFEVLRNGTRRGRKAGGGGEKQR